MERFETVFENSLLGNKIISSDLKIMQVNPALVRLLGYDRKEEIIGTRILDYAPEHCHGDWRQLQEKLWKKLMPSFSLETCLLKRDGTLVWCQVTSILFEENGETFGYTIIEDVTEKYYLKMQKDEFISVASHELKTPITVLQANLQLIDRGMVVNQPISHNLVKFFDVAARNLTKLNHLVNDLLSSTTIERGELALNKSVFPISEVIDGCCTHIRLEGKYKIDYTGDHTLKVYADKYKIDQVLVNFVNNAVKYCPESMTIVIHVEKIKGATKVAVIDAGQGIAPENCTKLFERYFRAAKHNVTAGLGLGLYISAEIVKRHGGKIGVDSVVGKGSTFWFTIPDGKAPVKS